MSPRQTPDTRRLVVELGAAALARFFLNIARRFAYPFAPAIARGLEVPLTRVTSLVAINQSSGLLSPVLGPAVDRWGPRALMLLGLGGLALGMLAAARVQWERRGFAIGLIEFAWSGSSLAGIPLLGVAIERYGWRSPFFILGALAVASLVMVALLVPRIQTGAAASRPVRLRETWGRLLRRRTTVGALGYTFCFSMANDTVFVIYGAWLE